MCLRGEVEVVFMSVCVRVSVYEWLFVRVSVCVFEREWGVEVVCMLHSGASPSPLGRG